MSAFVPISTRGLQNNQQFFTTIEGWKRKLTRRLDVVSENFTIRVIQTIVMGGSMGNPGGTPVDDGVARNSYWVTRNVPGTEGPDLIRKIVAGDVSRGQRNVDLMAAVVRAGKAGDIFYLNNNAPYIRRLEYGWSKQAPAGMIRLTLMNAQAIMDDEVRKLGKV